MRKYNPKVPLFSLHVPKCGGTSFRDVLKGWFKNKLYYHYHDQEKNILPICHNFKRTRFKIPTGFEKDVCVHGHFYREMKYGVLNYYPYANQFITVLRDPLDQQVSHYSYLAQRTKEGLHFVNGSKIDCVDYNNIDDYLLKTKSFLLDFFPWEFKPGNYKNIIKEYFVDILLLENIQNDMERLSTKLNKDLIIIPKLNKSEICEQASQPVIEEFIKRHEFEYEVYNFAKDYFQNQ